MSPCPVNIIFEDALRTDYGTLERRLRLDESVLCNIPPLYFSISTNLSICFFIFSHIFLPSLPVSLPSSHTLSSLTFIFQKIYINFSFSFSFLCPPNSLMIFLQNKRFSNRYPSFALIFPLLSFIFLAASPSPVKIIGNLPYGVATELLYKFIADLSKRQGE